MSGGREPSTAAAGAQVSLDWSDDDPASAKQEPVARGRAGHDLIVQGHGLIHRIDNGPLIAVESVLATANVESLSSAVRDPRRCCAGLPEAILVGLGDPDRFDPESSDHDPVHIEVDDQGVYASLRMLVTRPGVEAAEYRAWLQPAAEAHGCVVAAVRLTDECGVEIEKMASWWPAELKAELEEHLALERSRPRYATVRVTPVGSMTVASLLAAGRDVLALLSAIKGGPINVVSAGNLIRATLPHLLVGLAECEWFEAKRQAHNLQGPGNAGKRAKIELAQDVARFANGDMSAILVVGLRTTKENGRDVVQAVTPEPLPALSIEQHRDVIDSHVFPAVEGLTVEVVKMGAGKGLLMISVPAQAADHKPFLVHGAVVGDRVEGSFLSIVRRRGEGSIVTTASQVHAQLTAGRALLQEMSTDRLRQEKERPRRKSDEAARAVLAEVAQADDACHAPPGSGEFSHPIVASISPGQYSVTPGGSLTKQCGSGSSHAAVPCIPSGSTGPPSQAIRESLRFSSCILSEQLARRCRPTSPRRNCLRGSTCRTRPPVLRPG